MRDGFTAEEVTYLKPGYLPIKASGTPNYDDLLETVDRRISYWNSMTSGYDDGELTKLRKGKGVFPNPGADQLVIVRHIPFYSLCEHHTAPFFGVASVGYLPDQKVIGLSKINRVVNAYARRLQIQERLTRQVAEFLYELLACQGVAVRVEARHLCMEARGVQQQGQTTITTSLQGKMRDKQAQQEFVSAVQVPLPRQL